VHPSRWKVFSNYFLKLRRKSECQASLKRSVDAFRQKQTKVKRSTAGAVGALDILRGEIDGSAAHKISCALHRSKECATAGFKCRMLKLLLKRNAAQRTLVCKIIFAHRNHDSGICPARVPAIGAHAIGAQLSIAGGAADYKTAGTHAERIHPPAAFAVFMAEKIIR